MNLKVLLHKLRNLVTAIFCKYFPRSQFVSHVRLFKICTMLKSDHDEFRVSVFIAICNKVLYAPIPNRQWFVWTKRGDGEGLKASMSDKTLQKKTEKWIYIMYRDIKEGTKQVPPSIIQSSYKYLPALHTSGTFESSQFALKSIK